MAFRKLLLVALDYTRPKDPPISLGQASIASYMKQNKIDFHESSWAVNSTTFNVDDVVSFIMQYNHSDIDVGIGAFVWNEKFCSDYFESA
jgi:hypothetical protein